MIRLGMKTVFSGAAIWMLSIAPYPGTAQPLDTTSESGPAPSDTLLRDTTSVVPLIKVGADSTGQTPFPGVQQTIQITHPAMEAESDAIFSLFNYGKIVEVGPSLNYFSYHENVDINPIIQEFRTKHTYQPVIAGTPKSTEYGAVLGFNLSVMRAVQKPRLFIRPSFALLLGLANTYDGSLQADTSLAAGTITFSPIKGQKNNFFLAGGCDLGYLFLTMKCPLTLYSGIHGKIWYRDMTLYSQQSSSASASELYCWFSVPLGAVITRPVSPRLLVGCDPRIDFMFYGMMQASETSASGGSFYFPALRLGNRASYRLDAFLQTRMSGPVSLKFDLYAMLYGFAASAPDTAIIPAEFSGNGDQRVVFMEPASASFWIGFNFQVAFLRQSYQGEKAAWKR